MFASNKERDVNCLTLTHHIIITIITTNVLEINITKHLQQIIQLEFILLHFSTGEVGLVVVNISDKEEIVEIEMKNYNNGKTLSF